MSPSSLAHALERSGEPAPEPSWYACYTRSRHEKRVETMLCRGGFESFLPLVPRETQWKDRKKVVAWPLFPSYVFGRFRETEIHRVLGIPGLATVVRSNGRPVAIHPDEIENVRCFANALVNAKVELVVRPFLAEGQWVRVKEGPFQGVKGVVVEQRNRRRVLIGLKAIGQGLEVDFDVALLEPLKGT
ncbi:MAG: UpxY family transcription antiterminator [Gemmatimonadota bacterium]